MASEPMSAERIHNLIAKARKWMPPIVSNEVEALAAEVASLRERPTKEEYAKLGIEVLNLRERAERAERERDEVVGDASDQGYQTGLAAGRAESASLWSALERIREKAGGCIVEGALSCAGVGYDPCIWCIADRALASRVPPVGKGDAGSPGSTS